MRRFWAVFIPALILLACVCPATGGITETIDAMQGTIAAAMTEGPGMLTDLPQTLTAQMAPDVGLPGTILGTLSYPSDFLPAQRVIAFDAASMDVVAETTTVQGKGAYELSVPAGDYYVVAYTLDGGASAGYSQMVPCGLLASCTDHSLIVVHVESGAVVEGIDPQDWYAPEGTFPAMP